QRAVGRSTDSKPRLRGGGDKLLDLLPCHNVRGRSWQLLGAENRRRNLMVFVLGTEVAGESDYHPKPTGALRNRLCQSCPLDGDLGRNVMLLSCLGECSEAFQERTFAPQRETSRPTNSQISLDSSGQHGYTSGQGCAICRKAGISTLA